MTKTVVYLHGFASSSLSEKAQLTQTYFRHHYPQLDFTALDVPYEPVAALATIKQHLEQRDITTDNAKAKQLVLIGSSLGGFLATCIAEQYGCRACLINPAVAPHLVLSAHLGEYFHPVLQQTYQVTLDHMASLKQLMPKTLRQPENYLVLLQTGDEVLDYRLAVDYYQGATLIIEQGGNHSFVDYQQQLSTITEFCQLN
ncbi:YqiA/YcfP family alpha/beta fold hydrolase [Rheinheimera sp. MMS21-TC3]|uniref:YqiA/YcfP family alpha/beta fold hydrolase n=1 Tax=Rheinheimera sp. MMS21-TC3 TaxID=3072790 RepID=UPI0028C47ADE|nr:YqiA/YcfP family alpha/beta fold hydrolase [Rheinheimera sp. MMS21-TC3]WNO60123.1 YqiA/YcfP family alpha/beta fold hydrolase [Rheinheimera sp. MMS21-TC3]